jgi:hypothetical protein
MPQTYPPAVYRADNFSGRVNHAAAVISRRGNATRTFDACFEMYDGSAVAAALVRRAAKNPRLAENLPRYLGPSAWEAHRELEGRNLADAAREMRAHAEAAHDAKAAAVA